MGPRLSLEPRRGPDRLAARALRERGDLGSEQAVAGGRPWLGVLVDLLELTAFDCQAGYSLECKFDGMPRNASSNSVFRTPWRGRAHLAFCMSEFCSASHACVTGTAISVLSTGNVTSYDHKQAHG